MFRCSLELACFKLVLLENEIYVCDSVSSRNFLILSKFAMVNEIETKIETKSGYQMGNRKLKILCYAVLLQTKVIKWITNEI